MAGDPNEEFAQDWYEEKTANMVEILGEELLAKLKKAGHYPYSDLSRASVV